MIILSALRYNDEVKNHTVRFAARDIYKCTNIIDFNNIFFRH